MSLTITLTKEQETLFRRAAERDGVPVEVIAVRSLEENELLWRISTATPESETHQLHRLLHRQQKGILTAEEKNTLLTLIEAREKRAAERMEDLVRLANLRKLSVRELMNQLGITPIVFS
jgi:hypothetical protein